MKRRPIPTRWDQLNQVPPLPARQRPPSTGADNFLPRVEAIVRGWVQEEWVVRETIAAEAAKGGWTAQRKAAYEAAVLNPENLAHRLDNISIATLRRELKKLNAPTPGQIIRDTRLEYGKHLLTHTRLLVSAIAARAGYQDETHFTLLFRKVFGATPSDYRRKSIRKAVKTP